MKKFHFRLPSSFATYDGRRMTRTSCYNTSCYSQFFENFFCKCSGSKPAVCLFLLLTTTHYHLILELVVFGSYLYPLSFATSTPWTFEPDMETGLTNVTIESNTTLYFSVSTFSSPNSSSFS